MCLLLRPRSNGSSGSSLYFSLSCYSGRETLPSVHSPIAIQVRIVTITRNSFGQSILYGTIMLQYICQNLNNILLPILSAKNFRERFHGMELLGLGCQQPTQLHRAPQLVQRLRRLLPRADRRHGRHQHVRRPPQPIPGQF